MTKPLLYSIFVRNLSKISEKYIISKFTVNLILLLLFFGNISQVAALNADEERDDNFFTRNVVVNCNLIHGVHSMVLENVPRLPAFGYSDMNFHVGMSGRLYAFERIVANAELHIFYKPISTVIEKNYLGVRGTGISAGLGYAKPFLNKSELLFSAGYGKNYANINHAVEKEHRTHNYKLKYPCFKNYKTVNDFMYLSFAYYFNFNSARSGSGNRALKSGIKVSYQIDLGDSYSSHFYKENYPRISTEGFLLSLIFGTTQR